MYRKWVVSLLNWYFYFGVLWLSYWNKVPVFIWHPSTAMQLSSALATPGVVLSFTALLSPGFWWETQHFMDHLRLPESDSALLQDSVMTSAHLSLNNFTPQSFFCFQSNKPLWFPFFIVDVFQVSLSILDILSNSSVHLSTWLRNLSF